MNAWVLERGRSVVRLALGMAVALFTAVAAHALDSARALTQYPLRSWQARDGLPQNSVQAIVQTRDGYIWLGTQEGLVRFDGVQFTVFDRGNVPALGNNYVFALHEDSAGALWIGTYGGGLTRLQDGQFTTFTTRDGLTDDTVLAIREDGNRNLWLGTGRGVTLRTAGRFRAFDGDAALRGQRVMAVLPARDGSVWFGTYTGGLGRWREGRFERTTTREGLSHDTVWSLHEGRAGAVWVGTVGGGLNRLEDGRITSFRARDGLGSDNVFGILEDRQGTLWLATDGAGLVRYAGGRFSSLTQANGLVNDTTWPLLEDRDGSLWVGTLGGLSQLRDTPFTLVGVPEGAPERVILTASEDRAGALWLGGSTAGLARLVDGKASYFRRKDGLPSDSVRSVYPDRDGNVWIGTIDGLARMNAAGIRVFDRRDGLSIEKISAIHQDRAGTLWFGTFGGGVNKLLPGGRFDAYTASQGLANDRVVAIADRRAGGLWLATDGGGLSAFDGGRFTNYGVPEGLAELHLEAVHEDADGTLWLGGGGSGLSRMRDGRFTRFATAQGLLDEVIHCILEDGQGHLWLSSNHGLQRVSKRELEEVAAGRRATLRPRLFAEADGMRSREFNGNSQPSCWHGARGRLWFAGMEGVVGVDPDRIAPIATPHAVLVEKAMAQGGEDIAPGARLEPGKRSLEFRYTALHYANPGLLRFRYRLAGFDKDWIDAGTRRAAFYTNLAPGRYRFEVSASLPDGAWTAPSSALSFVLLPSLHETWWFRAGALLFLVLLLGWGNHTILSRHRRRAEVLAGMVLKREQAEAEVRQLNTELETRVAARTAELEAANRALESFNYAVSHDLRAPLAAITGFSSLLAEKGPALSEARARQLPGRIHANALHMGTLIDNLLKLSQISRGELQWRAIDLSAMAAEIASGLREANPARDVQVDIDPGLVARGDPGLVRIALENLLGNAWKYTGQCAHARIELRAEPGDDGPVYHVRDNGAGFDMALAVHLFEPFRRMHNSTDFPGTGIGLSIVRRVVERHGGRIWAESAEHQGACFRFTLGAAPVVDGDQADRDG